MAPIFKSLSVSIKLFETRSIMSFTTLVEASITFKDFSFNNSWKMIPLYAESFHALTRVVRRHVMGASFLLPTL